jgi:acetoin utilization protein AcuB
MVASALINYTIPTLKPTDTVEKAIELMEFYNLNKLVIADNETFRGLIALEFLENQKNQKAFLMDLLPEFEGTFVYSNQHIIEILKISNTTDNQVIAVVENGFLYKGSILRNDLLSSFAKQFGAEMLGAIIVLAINDLDYSLAEIARLIETNDTKVISSYLFKNSDLNKQNLLTLQLNKQEISRAIATLERFGYEIVAVYANEKIETFEKERFDLLMKYLEM